MPKTCCNAAAQGRADPARRAPGAHLAPPTCSSPQAGQVRARPAARRLRSSQRASGGTTAVMVTRSGSISAKQVVGVGRGRQHDGAAGVQHAEQTRRAHREVVRGRAAPRGTRVVRRRARRSRRWRGRCRGSRRGCAGSAWAAPVVPPESCRNADRRRVGPCRAGLAGARRSEPSATVRQLLAAGGRGDHHVPHRVDLRARPARPLAAWSKPACRPTVTIRGRLGVLEQK